MTDIVKKANQRTIDRRKMIKAGIKVPKERRIHLSSEEINAAWKRVEEKRYGQKDFSAQIHKDVIELAGIDWKNSKTHTESLKLPKIHSERLAKIWLFLQEAMQRPYC